MRTDIKIALGSDKSGFQLKEVVKANLIEEGYQIIEVGTVDVEKPFPFYDTAPLVCTLLQKGEADMGILICGTGMGMSQVANKFSGIRAACVESLYGARMSRAINDSNVLCMGGWVITERIGVEMANVFLETEFTQGLEEWRKEFLRSAKQKFLKLENELLGGEMGNVSPSGK